MGIVQSFQNTVRKMFTAPQMRGETGVSFTLDDPSAIKYLSPNSYNANLPSHLTPKQALGISAVYACVDLIGRTIAMLPWKTFMKQDDGDRVEINHSASYYLAKAPNNKMSAFDMRKTALIKYCLFGKAFIRIKRDQRGHVYEMNLENSLRTDILENDDGEIFYKFYRSGSTEVVHSADVIHFKNMSLDGLTSFGPIQASDSTFGIAYEMDNSVSANLKDGPTISGYVQHPEHLDKDGYVNYVDAINNYFTSAEYEGKVGLLDGGATFKPMKNTMRDSQYNENKRLQIEEICRIFGVPPHKIGHLEKASFNNIEQQNIEFVQTTIQPIVAMIEQATDMKLFGDREKNKYTKIILKGLLRGDTEAQAEFIDKMIKLGVYDINDARRYLDMNKVENGDTRIIPTNMIDLEQFKKFSKKMATNE